MLAGKERLNYCEGNHGAALIGLDLGVMGANTEKQCNELRPRSLLCQQTLRS